jgi:hypothetical protein
MFGALRNRMGRLPRAIRSALAKGRESLPDAARMVEHPTGLDRVAIEKAHRAHPVRKPVSCENPISSKKTCREQRELAAGHAMKCLLAKALIVRSDFVKRDAMFVPLLGLFGLSGQAML